MPNFKLEFKDGKFDFDHALENMYFDKEAFEKALERFASIQAAPFKNKLWKQYNEWKKQKIEMKEECSENKK
jgi:hypothetical protein